MQGWTGRITRVAIAGAIAVAGVVVGTGSAHANSAELCRSQVVGSYAPVIDNIQLDSCYHVEDDRKTIYATVPFTNHNEDNITICAHLVNVATGAWAHDFGCDYQTNSWEGTAWPGNCCYGTGMEWYADPGTYVVSAGLWLNGQYYGDVESPRTQIG